jgi:hypothetical protein
MPLVSLVQHAGARVLGQVIVALKRDERSAIPGLLAGRDLTGRVVTLDALSASQLGAGGLGSDSDEGRRNTPGYSSGSGRRITVIPSQRNRSRTSATVGARPSC